MIAGLGARGGTMVLWHQRTKESIMSFADIRRRHVIRPVRSWAQRLVQKAGYDLKRYAPPGDELHRLVHFCHERGTKLLLDVGANVGQFALLMRQAGFRETIVSFEPQRSAHTALRNFAVGDNRWIVGDRLALGSRSGEIEINIAANSQSSSVLRMRDRHVRGDPSSSYVTTEKAPMTTLNLFVAAHPELERRNCALKVDTQGYEMEVLIGAADLLPEVAVVFLEMSLVELYEGQASFIELFAFLENLGFSCVSLAPVFADRRSFEVLQVDGMFLRK
jgi:FkbM family methyltransferase